MSSPQEVTRLLQQWRTGDAAALEALTPLVYGELRRLAERQMRCERPDHTLQATALVHEAYLRLAGPASPDWQDRAHFFAVAARLMRRILVDHARARRFAKRGGGAVRVSLDEAAALWEERAGDLVALDEALERLGALDPLGQRIVELRFFGGLSVEESAEALGVSPAAVKRGWRSARAWLHAELSAAPQVPGAAP